MPPDRAEPGISFRSGRRDARIEPNCRSQDTILQNYRHTTQKRSVFTFIMSREITSKQLLELTRSHWKIENSLHWALDVVMNEDQLRNRNQNGPECLAAFRRIAPGIVRLMDEKNTLKGRMQIAAMSDEYLTRLLNQRSGKILRAKALLNPDIPLTPRLKGYIPYRAGCRCCESCV